MCTEARTSKKDDETDDNLQQSGKVRREGWMTEKMSETGTCVGYDWTRGNHLDNQRIASGENWSLGYLQVVHSDHSILVIGRHPTKSWVTCQTSLCKEL